MQQATGAKWAWLQLGLQYLDQGDAGQAIKALQHVIRADPNDKYKNITYYFILLQSTVMYLITNLLCIVIAGNLWRMHI